MTKENLLVSAKKLSQPSVEIAEEFSAKKDQMVSEINQIMSARPDLEKLIGEGNLDMMRDNHRNHARFMGSMFIEYHPEVLVETVLWVFRAYRSHGFKLTYWSAQLDTWVEIFKKMLSENAYKGIYPFYNWMIIHIPVFVKLSDSQLSSEDSNNEN